MSREAYPDLISALSDFSTKSFTELQAAAYIALIKMGEESGSAVAGEAGINRSKIYDILGQLEEMGAVAKVSREGKSRYVAIPPDNLLPKLVDKFKNDINKARDGLNNIMDLQEGVTEANITLTSLDVESIDTNDFDYLISSNEKSRFGLVDKLPRDFRPSPEVKILSLNKDQDGRGCVLLLGSEVMYLFDTPTGNKVDALQITSQNFIDLFRGIIVSAWVEDIPENVKNDVESGVSLVFVVDKALYVHFELNGSKGEYDRPVSFTISDEFITFYYEGMEEPKMPLQFLSKVELLDDKSTIKAIFENPSRIIGSLQMRVVSNPQLIRNILQFIVIKNKESL